MPILALDGVSPKLPPIGDFFIAPCAYVIGKVSLGRGVSVWYGSVLRGDNELLEVGDETNVQEHCVFHTDEGLAFKVGRGCTIGHRALLGAHTLITEGKTIPAGSVVMGSPGKIIRAVSPEEIAGFRASAHHYVEASRRFLTQPSEGDV